MRLDSDLAQEFDRLRSRSGQTISDAAAEAIRTWLRQHTSRDTPIRVSNARDLQASLRESLVNAVAEQLRSRPDWADTTIRTLSLLDPVVSIYMQRVHNFYQEKKALAEKFVPWLVQRILHHSREREVCLVVESGTTLKAVMDALGPALQAGLAKDPTATKPIQIITNNFPGAESYEAFASKADLNGQKVAQRIPCDVVPGRALWEYSAIVGDKAEAYLRERCAETRDRQGIRIGLTVGIWVMLEEQPMAPKPLAKGEHHQRFKEVVLEQLPHLVYAYDENSLDSFEEQLHVELPHVLTREDDFRKRYFRIQDE